MRTSASSVTRLGLAHAVEYFTGLAAKTPNEELRDAATVGALIARSALRRRESRGSHFRLDYPVSADSERHRTFLSLTDAPLAGTA